MELNKARAMLTAAPQIKDKFNLNFSLRMGNSIKLSFLCLGAPTAIWNSLNFNEGRENRQLQSTHLQSTNHQSTQNKLIEFVCWWLIGGVELKSESWFGEEGESIKHSNSILNQFHKLAGIDGIEWIVCWMSNVAEANNPLCGGQRSIPSNPIPIKIKNNRFWSVWMDSIS